MDDDMKKKIFITSIVILAILTLIILFKFMILPMFNKNDIEDYDINEDIAITQNVDYTDISFENLKKDLKSESKFIEIIDEAKLDTGLDRFIGQGKTEEDRVVLEVIGNKKLDKVSSIYLITWNEEGSNNPKTVDQKYMVELLRIIFPYDKTLKNWIGEALGQLGSEQIVNNINGVQIGMMSMDGFQTIGLSVLSPPEKNG